MRSLALLLHFYQPPTQSPAITEQVLRSCYLPLADLLLAHPEAQFTLNIAMNPGPEFVEKIKTLLKRKQVELSNSPIYHPLLPLLNSEEIATRLEINRTLLRDAYETDPVNIILPPELAINANVLATIKRHPGARRAIGSSKKIDVPPGRDPASGGTIASLQHDNNDTIVIIDESAINPEFDLNKIPQLPAHVSSRAVTEILRSYPKELTVDIFTKFIEQRTTENQTVTVVSDAEVFGHHYTERINLMRDLLECKKIKFVKVTDIDASGEASSSLIAPLQHDVIASSWQTTNPENPYSLWIGNDLQKKYDNLAQLVYHSLQKSPDPNPPAEKHYYQGTSSCHYYWLSNWPWWHPDLVESGARELIKCVRSLYIDRDQKLPAEKLFHEFLMQMWSYHWSGEVEKKWLEYNNSYADSPDYQSLRVGSAPAPERFGTISG